MFTLHWHHKLYPNIQCSMNTPMKGDKIGERICFHHELWQSFYGQTLASFAPLFTAIERQMSVEESLAILLKRESEVWETLPSK